MNLFILIILTAIFIETSFLSLKQLNKRSLKSGRIARRRVFVDTSTLMDGRILSVARAGFIGDELLIPRSVTRELQLLADGSDPEKRARARFGLDVASELMCTEQTSARVYTDKSGNRIKVDERLLELAKKNGGIILTNDLNLSKVAATEHIYTININDLAQGLRGEYLPGDHLNVRIINVGSSPKQGVAYLPDGTMIVVDDGEKYAGKNHPVEVEFLRYLQTSAGRMMFAKVVEQKPFKEVKNNSLYTKKKTPLGTKKRETSKSSPAKVSTPKSREDKVEDSLIRIANK